MNDTFFDLFRTLEENLKGNPEMDFLERYSITMQQDSRLQPYYDEMRFFKYLRNIEAHRNDSMNYFVITDQSVQLIRKILDYIQYPLRAIQMGLAVDIKTLPTLNSPLLPLVRVMHQENKLILPVLNENAHVIGVFSDEVLVHAFIKEHSLSISKETTLKSFERYILLPNHLNESFLFIDHKMPLQDIERLFQKPQQNSKPITALLVTETGKMTEPLLRIISPWDILKQPSFQITQTI